MNDINVILFSTALTEKVFDQIASECVNQTPTYSGVGFDNNIACGLAEDKRIRKVIALSFYPIPSWPRYKKLLKEETEYYAGKLTVYAPRIVDLPILKELSYYIGVRRYLKKCDIDGETVVLTSGLYRSLLRCARYVKRSGHKVISVVPDIPEIMMTYRKDYSGLRKIINKLDARDSEKYRKSIDGFVLLSPYMNEVVNKHAVPWCVMDGLVNLDNFPEKSVESDRPYLLYAGKVSVKFGIDRLCKAFIRADLKDFDLVICGNGDYADELKEIAGKETNIKYLGPVSHNEVLKLEKGAKLLVEPRPSDDILVKMSFPSKILEYMASGTPVLCTNLPCYSPEYREYQYRIDDESVEGLCEAISTTLAIPPDELVSMGRKAQVFVLENKTIVSQCNKVASFIEEIIRC